MTDHGGARDVLPSDAAHLDGGTPVAAFDFDGTLTHCDSLLPFLRCAVGRRRFWAKSPYLLRYLLLYRFGRLERSLAKERVLQLYVGGWPAAEVQSAAERFAVDELPSLINRAAMERLRWHQQAQHGVLIVSASMEAYIQPWAEAVGGIEAVLATRLQVEGGRVTGRLDGLNCSGPEKVCRLTEHLGALDGHYVFAYGDSSSDLELLGVAREPAYRSFAGRWDRARGLVRLLRALL